MGGGRRVSHRPLVCKASEQALFGSADVFAEAIPLRKSGKIIERKMPVASTQQTTNPKTKAKAPKSDAKKNQSAVLPVTKEDLHSAIETLYADELKPYGRILRKRLAERNVNAGKEVDLGMLRKFCEGDAQLRVASEEGGEWSSLFASAPEPFVDVYSKEDMYPEATWQAAAEYFEALSTEEGVLPGGRYACAQTLSSRNLPFFQHFTLGRICHFVQIAISTRKVLGYLNGGITSYSRSHSCMKDNAASHKASCAQPAIVSELTIASWKDARKCLKQILTESLEAGVDQVPLSNIKRICRSQFQIELSETSLGHSKLSDFLQDERLSNICTVRLLDQGYFVIPQFELSDSVSDCEAGSSESSAFSFDEDRLQLELNDIDENCDTPYWPDQVNVRASPQHFNISLDVIEAGEVQFYSMSPRAKMVQNTFIHAPATPIVRVNRRSHSVPRNVGRVCRSPLLRPPVGNPNARSPATSTLTPINVASPLDLLPQTPDQWSSTTPGASPYPYALHSVPESQALEPEKFNWADQDPSRTAFGCSLDDFPGLEIDVQEPMPASPSPFFSREAPLLAGLNPARVPVSLCLSDHI